MINKIFKVSREFRKVFFIIFSLFLAIPLSASAGWSIYNISGYGLPQGSISFIVENVMMWILGVVGFVAIIGFAISGFLYFTAAGSEDQAKTAKRAMLYSVLGVLVTLSAWVISAAIFNALNGSDGF